MTGGPLRPGCDRAGHAGRRPRRWRLPATGGIFAVIIGAACWAPLAAPTALAPGPPAGPAADAPGGPSALRAAQKTPEAPVVSVAGVVAAAPPRVIPVAATPTPLLRATPTPVLRAPPTPAVAPTLSASGQALLAAITSDRSAQWLKNHAETPLRSAPNDNALVFTRLPQWSLLKQLENRPDWIFVQYGGDGKTRQAGPGWVRARDVGGVDAPPVWLSGAKTGTLWSAPDTSGQRVLDLPPMTLMEVMATDDVRGTRVHVRLPGDGRSVPPSQGWVDADVVARTRTPSVVDLPRGYPEDLSADVRISVPYRTQLDGSDYEGANCGPTVLGMVLESFGLNVAPPDVRTQVLDAENFDTSDPNAGAFIWALADVAQTHGLQARGLYLADGSLHRWSLDEIRASVQQGQPVIVQVVYRGLPGREDSAYSGDHYIVVTGLLGDNFLYNDPIGGAAAHEAPGYDRVITATQLRRAMRASDTRYAYTAFSLSRN